VSRCATCGKLCGVAEQIKALSEQTLAVLCEQPAEALIAIILRQAALIEQLRGELAQARGGWGKRKRE
jgi:hypothetical protein